MDANPPFGTRRRAVVVMVLQGIDSLAVIANNNNTPEEHVLLDTGIAPQQRQALLGQAGEIVFVNEAGGRWVFHATEEN